MSTSPWKSEDVLGWAAGQNRWGDPTGIYHLLVSVRRGEHLIAVPACGTTARTSGQLERPGPPLQHECLRCTASQEKAARRLAKQKRS